MNTLRRTSELLSAQLCGAKEVAIKKAISHVLGTENWELEKVIKKANFVKRPDGTEVFTFDGKELIHFKVMESEVTHDTFGQAVISLKQKYIQLYED